MQRFTIYIEEARSSFDFQKIKRRSSNAATEETDGSGVDGPRRPFFQTRFDIEKQFCFLADLYLSLVISLHGVRGTENRGRDIANKGLTAAQNVTAELPSGPLRLLPIFCPRPANMAEYHKREVRWGLENAEEVLNACGIGKLQTPPVDCLEI
jgi:hypothetical protein